MAGVDRTPDGSAFGILVPEPLTNTATRGTHYTEADTFLGPVTPSGTTRSRFQCNGTLSSEYDLTWRVTRAGAPGYQGAGIGFQRSTDSTWFGRESPRRPMQWRFITGSVFPLDAVVLIDDVLLMVDSDGEVHSRSAAGVWTTTISTLGGGSPQAATLLSMPDGAVLALSFNSAKLRVERSTDSGATWQTQRFNALGGALGETPRKCRAARSGNGGEIVLFVTTGTDTSSKTYQYVSGDEGVTWTLIDTMTRTTVHECVFHSGRYHVVMVELDSTDKLKYRILGNGTQALDTTASRTFASSVDHDDDTTATITDEGELVTMWVNSSADGIVTTAREAGDLTSGVSPDTWWAYGSSGYALEDFVMRYVRGATVLLTSRDSGAAIPTCIEITMGGHADVTVNEVDVQPAWDKQYFPIDVPANYGWSDTDTGSPVRAYADHTLGLNVDCSAGTAKHTLAITFGSNTRIVTHWIVRCNNTSTSLRVEDGEHHLEVDLTPTGIRAYDGTGSAPSYTTHNAGGEHLEIITVQQVTASSAAFTVWYRVRGGSGSGSSHKRAFSQLTGTLSGASSNEHVEQECPATSDVDWMHFGYLLDDGSAALSTLSIDLTASSPFDVLPVPLGFGPVWVDDGASVQAAEGQCRIDAVTFTATMVSPYRIENVDPTLHPSPSTVWRSAGQGADVTLSWSIPRTQAGRRWVSLLNIWGFHSVTIEGTAYDMRQGFRYSRLGTSNTVVPYTGGTAGTINTWWVAPNDLVGWVLIDAAGAAHEVVGNTAGTLTPGIGDNVPRCSIQLATQPDAGGNVAAYLVPNYIHVATETNSADGQDGTLSVTILSANALAVSGKSYFQIGKALVGRPHMVPRAPDFSDSQSLRTEANLQTSGDGRTVSRRQHRDRKVWMLGWTESHSDSYDVAAGSTNVNTVPVARNNGSQYDTTLAGALPYLLEGVIAEAAGGVVLAAHFFSWGNVATVSVVPTRHRGGWLYGRIITDFTREGVPLVGRRLSSQAFRIPQLTFREEL